MTSRLSRTTLISLLVAILALTLLPGAPAGAGSVYEGTKYREEFFSMGDALQTRLHADLLRDEDVSWSVEQPVIMVVSPYTNHTTSAASPLYGNPAGGGGMHERFFDFIDATDAIELGYTLVVVDLPGFGGSGGCNDWGGPVEQAAVAAAVEWAAGEEWSNGRVGLLGKSYDAWTGLMGMAQDAQHGVEGLEAVISMEPVFSGYRYGYNNGVRFTNSVATPALFSAIDATPGGFNDSPEYLVGSVGLPYCYGINIALQQQDDENVDFWAIRDLVRQAAGSDVPLFLTQGFLETNTKVDAALDFWNALDHGRDENHFWIGQFDHVRGYEKQGERFAMGREVFAAQAMAFLDEHLKGEGDADFETVAVQDNLGRYREEAAYPPADMQRLVTDLTPGSYADGTGGGIISISQPLEHDTWLAGEPIFSADVTTTVPRGNITVLTYDVNPEDGTATLINRGTSLIRGVGDRTVDIQLYAQDWFLPAGHHIAVEVRGTNGFWVHVPTGQTVTVNSAEINLPFLTDARTDFLDGGSTPRLEQHLNGADDSDDYEAGTPTTFTLPGALQ